MLYIDSSVLLILLCFSLSVYGLISLGWFSNSNYSSLGSIRSVSQSISYEIVLSFCIFSMSVFFITLNIKSILYLQEYVWNFLPFIWISIIMLISFLAEGNRSPFDLSEGESASVWLLCSIWLCFLYLSKNISLMFISLIYSVLFIGINFMFVKVSFIVILFVWIRATMPRIRFDNIIELCWLFFMSVVLCIIIFYVVLV